jgi:hypothetical protein
MLLNTNPLTCHFNVMLLNTNPLTCHFNVMFGV